MAILQPNPLMQFISEMMAMAGDSGGEIKIPKQYREQVIAIKNVLTCDTSGMVNAILDFAIDAAGVNYRVECADDKLKVVLNSWLRNINSAMRGKIPTGINPLAKEYHRERWKGSSFMLLRTFWEKKDGLTLPTTLYYVNGEDIIEKDTTSSANIDTKNYWLKTGDGKDDKKRLPSGRDERIFVQKPYDAWGTVGATPFLLARGIYKNLKFLDLLERKGEYVVSKALEYIALLKKGTEAMVLSNNPDFVYSKEDLDNVKKDVSNYLRTRQYENGTPAYLTNFDTSLEHIIPEYSKVLKAELFAPIERRIIAGLGLIEIVSGITMTRRESIMMPKPFFAEVEESVSDFKTMLLDVIYTMKDMNPTNSIFKAVDTVQIHNSIIEDSISERFVAQIRAGYDRGVVSKQTFIDVLGLDPEVEIKRRADEYNSGLEDVLYPPIITNNEKDPDVRNTPGNKPTAKPPKADDELKTQKKAVNKGEVEDETEAPPEEVDAETAKVLEGGPYPSIDSLPSAVKDSMTPALQKVFMEVFNKSLPKYGEPAAFKVAWAVINRIAKKKGDKWVKVKKGNVDDVISKTENEMTLDDELSALVSMKKLEVLEKQSKLLSKITDDGGDTDETTE